MVNITVNFNRKKQRQNEVLAMFLKETLNTQNINAIEIFPEEAFFQVKFLCDGDEQSERFSIAQLPKDVKKCFYAFRSTTLCNGIYSQQILNAYLNNHFDKLSQEVVSHYFSCDERLQVTLQNIEDVKISYDTQEMQIKEILHINYGQAKNLYGANECICFENVTIKFVEQNEKYVTETMILSAIRNRSNRSGSSSEPIYTENCGKFSLYSSDEIKQVIRRLVQSGALLKRRISGMYGSYYIYKINSEIVHYFKTTSEYQLKEMAKKVDRLNDEEAEYYFRYFQSKEQTQMGDYLELLKLSKVKGFRSLYQEEFVKAFINAPKEFFLLLKMKIEIEEDVKIKKLYKEIYKLMKL